MTERKDPHKHKVNYLNWKESGCEMLGVTKESKALITLFLEDRLNPFASDNIHLAAIRKPPIAKIDNIQLINITERGIPSIADINPTTPQTNAYKETACTTVHNALKPI